MTQTPLTFPENREPTSVSVLTTNNHQSEQTHAERVHFRQGTADLRQAGSRVLLSGVHRHVSATFHISTGGRIRMGRLERPGAAALLRRRRRCCCCCPRMNCEILWALHNYKTAGTFSLLSGASGTDFCTCIYKTKHLFLELKHCNNMSS